MTRGFVGVAVAVFLTASADAVQQAKPNFSGEWTSTGTPGNPSDHVIITHTEKQLTVRRPPHDGTGEHTAVYALDGIEKREVVGTSPNRMIKMQKAEWNGNQVVITEVTDRDDKIKIERRMTWALDAEGRLILESSMTGAPDGPKQAKTVFRKKQ